MPFTKKKQKKSGNFATEIVLSPCQITKMKNLILLILVVFSSPLWAQITITNTTFAAPGDVYHVAQDLDLAPFTITDPSSMAQTWDYSTLSADATREETIIDANTDPVATEYFPTADIVSPYVSGTLTFYAKINPNSIEAVGSSLNLLGYNLPLSLIQPYVLRQAPITYNSSDNNTASFGLDASVNAIPGLDTTLQNLNPIPFTTVDSFRVLLNINTNYVVDAFGKLTLPNTPTADVLRIKRTDALGYTVAVHVSSFVGGFWVDLPLGDLPIPTETNTYEFRDAIHHDPLLTASTLPVTGTVSTVSYRYVEAPAIGINPVSTQLNQVTIAPNPTTGLCQIQTQTLANTIRVTSLAGKTIMEFTPLSTDLKIDLSGHPKGIYLVEVINTNNNKIVVEKIVLGR